ncbi:phosphate starvation protein PhoH [Porphyromonas macacae]|uniref:PhoH-like protein n=1 Tax=Porphyromonas macacae TaxID=28115 RepID=A0A379EAH7_9PORP|nr:PhoH family protein [Porphyromonas macacae]KGO00055.1 phosphate starvation protein PhoH [Porphyromonas macacae]SUB89372.1 PhoH-like protein [Porphyromonas macacae]
MTERLYILEDADPNVFSGVNQSNLALLSNIYPKVKIRMHKNVIKILGEARETEALLQLLEVIEAHCCKYNSLSEQDILNLKQGNDTLNRKNKAPDNLILYGLGGKAIAARGENQKKLVEEFEKNGLCFAIGPAGSGKTFIAISLAVKALKNKQVRRIILSRPAVEAGEKLGFLPGEMKDKLDPYLQPLYDALGEMIPGAKLRDYMDNGTIQIAPLAFMRGRTLNDAVIILDEAQNTTAQQMKMFLTRLGMGGKMIVTGDITQIDLPRGVRSGLKDALSILQDVPGIGLIEFNKKDIVRHPLVERIVDAYDNAMFTERDFNTK